MCPGGIRFFLNIIKNPFFSASRSRFSCARHEKLPNSGQQNVEIMEYKNEKNDAERCLECGDVITYGRPDKKFCCSACKNRWHNREGKGVRIYKLRVRSALDRNYMILNDLLKLGVQKMDMLQLRGLGYDPGYVTAMDLSGRRREFMCYDIRFRMSDHQISGISKIRVAPRRSGEKNVSLHRPEKEGEDR